MENKFYTIINADKPVLVDFYAAWCGPCQMLSPILKQVKDNLGERITILKIDTDKNHELTSKYNVHGVPTMILFKSGKQLWRQSGLLTKEQILGNIINETNQ